MQAFDLGAQEIQLQAWGNSVDQMLSVAYDIAALDRRVVVKLPITETGLEVAGAEPPMFKHTKSHDCIFKDLSLMQYWLHGLLQHSCRMMQY